MPVCGTGRTLGSTLTVSQSRSEGTRPRGVIQPANRTMVSTPLRPEGQRPNGTSEPRPASYAQYAGLGFTFAGTFLVLGACGWWLDVKLGTAPWLMLVGIALGAVGGFYSMVKRVPGGFGKSPEDPTDKRSS